MQLFEIRLNPELHYTQVILLHIEQFEIEQAIQLF